MAGFRNKHIELDSRHEQSLLRSACFQIQPYFLKQPTASQEHGQWYENVFAYTRREDIGGMDGFELRIRQLTDHIRVQTQLNILLLSHLWSAFMQVLPLLPIFLKPEFWDHLEEVRRVNSTKGRYVLLPKIRLY